MIERALEEFLARESRESEREERNRRIEELLAEIDARTTDEDRARLLDELVESLGLRIEPVTREQARTARAAHRDFGRGSGNRARLNFGDTFGYALAVETGEPLLFKGDGFGETDVRRALH